MGRQESRDKHLARANVNWRSVAVAMNAGRFAECRFVSPYSGTSDCGAGLNAFRMIWDTSFWILLAGWLLRGLRKTECLKHSISDEASPGSARDSCGSWE